jgi:hypothetical protein
MAMIIGNGVRAIGAGAAGVGSTPLFGLVAATVVADVASKWMCESFQYKYYKELECDNEDKWKSVCISIGLSMHANCVTNAITKVLLLGGIGHHFIGSNNPSSPPRPFSPLVYMRSDTPKMQIQDQCGVNNEYR